MEALWETDHRVDVVNGSDPSGLPFVARIQQGNNGIVWEVASWEGDTLYVRGDRLSFPVNMRRIARYGVRLLDCSDEGLARAWNRALEENRADMAVVERILSSVRDGSEQSL